MRIFLEMSPELAKHLIETRIALENLNSTKQDDNEYDLHENHYEQKLIELGYLISNYFNEVETNQLMKITTKK